jgi:16S rRNA (cytosine967-C5)-methyltransferase
MIGALRARQEAPGAVFNGQTYAPSEVTSEEAARFGQASEMPEPVAHDMPDWLCGLFQDSLADAALGVCRALAGRAPVDLRVNTAKASVEEAQMALAAEQIVTEPVPHVSTALRVTDGARRLARSAAYSDGLVELQDAASQLAVLRSPVPIRGRVLDFCAGGGGKALAMAARHEGPIHVHDIAPDRMRDLPARAARAGSDLRVWNGQAKMPFDLVFCDAPCSGSGTWRRTPQAKWNLTPEILTGYVAAQRSVLMEAAPLVRDGGTLVYATCSVLACENGDQVAWFQKEHGGFILQETCQLLPDAPGDGFYFGIFHKVQTTEG